MSYREQMAAEINEADRWSKLANRAIIASVTSWKACGRCSGKGYDFFLGGDRAPGVCFGCAGSGKLIQGRNEARRVAAESKIVDLNRLRFCWVAVNKALKTFTADPSSERVWLRNYTLAELTRTRDAYAAAAAN